MDILFILYNRAEASAFYRSTGIIHDLEHKGNYRINVIQWNEIGIDWSVISNYDVIFMQRAWTQAALDVCRFAQKHKKRIWIDWDDNLFQVNPENWKAYYTYTNPEIQKIMKQIIGLADVVTVTTDNLKAVLSSLNKNIKVIPNAFNDSMLCRSEPCKRTNNIVWRGGEGHIRDLWINASPLNKALKNFPDWRFMFLGFPPWFLDDHSNMGYLAMADITIYYQALYDMAPSCLHVPLADNPFYRCRSNVAYLEASYAGAVAIVPGWWDVQGALHYTDADGYYEALKSVLSGEVDVAVQNRIAWEYIMDELALSKVNMKRVEIIESLS